MENYVFEMFIAKEDNRNSKIYKFICDTHRLLDTMHAIFIQII